MKNNHFQAFLILSLSAFGSFAYCQGGTAFEPEASLLAVSKPAASPMASRASTGFHQRFPQLFTGMAIEIATSTYPMDKSNPVFRQFGNVRYEKLPEGGYSYLIMANFSNKEAALEFVQNVVKPKAEGARLIQYADGNRKVIRD